MFDLAVAQIQSTDALGHELVRILLFAIATLLTLAALSALERSGRSRRR